MMAATSEAFRSLGLDVSGVQAIAGASFGLELRPELADLHALGHAAPEIPDVHAERNGLSGRLSGGRGGGHAVTEIIEAFGVGSTFQSTIHHRVTEAPRKSIFQIR